MGQLKHKEAVFLSASVPNPDAPNFVDAGDPAAIVSSVSALLQTVLGRRPLVWGGHPAITPMVWAIAESVDVDFSEWVTLYQTSFFADMFPEENARFKNVVITEAVADDRSASLNVMRRQMFADSDFESAVFIGGMSGIFEEYEMLSAIHPDCNMLPVGSTGGAAAQLAGNAKFAPALKNDLDYFSLFHGQLKIDVREKRYSRLSDQPKEMADRLQAFS